MSSRRILIGTLSVVLTAVSPLRAQSAAISLALVHTTSIVDTIRQAAMTELRRATTAAHVDVCAPRTASAIKQTLIDALDSENTRSFDVTKPPGEAEGEFHAELIDCVASMHDPRAANALAGAVDTGMMAIGGLLGLGADVAVPELLSIVPAPGQRVVRRTAAIHTLGEITAPGSRVAVSTSDRARIRSALMPTLSDREPLVRAAGVRALRSFPDAEVQRLMVKLAAGDTGEVDGSGRREGAAPAARAWLRDYGSVVTKKP